ncbi:hypothetical protein ACSBR1_010104 [Camellia fascicularis]
MQLQELNNRFTEASTELLLCVACLNPNNSFCAFDKQKLIHLAEFYPSDFSAVDLMALDNQLQNYIVDMCSSNEFSELKRIGDLTRKLVETKKDIVYPACEIGIDFTSCDCNSKKSIFSNEIHKESIA